MENVSKFAVLSTMAMTISTFEQFSENSMKESYTSSEKERIVDVKTRAQGIVLNVNYSQVKSVKVKLMNTDLPDVVYYELDGAVLQQILQEVYKDVPLAVNQNQYVIIPFSVNGFFDLDDDQYIQVTVQLKDNVNLKWDKIVDYNPASNPLTIKKFVGNEFDSSKYDLAMFLSSDEIRDVRLNFNGQGVNLPQALFHNEFAVKAYSALKLIPDTNYFLSSEAEVFLVDF